MYVITYLRIGAKHCSSREFAYSVHICRKIPLDINTSSSRFTIKAGLKQQEVWPAFGLQVLYGDTFLKTVQPYFYNFLVKMEEK
jgi:hypothetical protein